MDVMIRNIRNAPRAVDVERIILPGELEQERGEKNPQGVLDLPPYVMDSLEGLAKDTGLDFKSHLITRQAAEGQSP